MNKLPWFTHDNDAHEDLFIQGAIRRFGHFGYAGYFMLIEVLDRHGRGDSVAINPTILGHKLRSTWPKVRQLLDYCQTNRKLQWKLVGQELNYSIPKFRERQSKLKSKVRATLPQPSSNLRQEREGEREREVLPALNENGIRENRSPRTGLWAKRV